MSIISWLGILFLITYDFLLADDGIKGNTWSELMRIHGQRHLVLPWLCGVLIGHLYHYDDNLLPLRGKITEPQAYNLIFWLSLIILGFGFLTEALNWDINIYVMSVFAIVGCVAGHYIWPIKREANKWKW